MSEFARYDETECIAIFDQLFPEGLGGDDVLREIAPDGWERSPLRDALKQDEGPEWAQYDPAEAFAKAQEDQERDRELAEMRASLDEDYHEAVENARQVPPPTTVAAYRSVFGRFPRGWPPGCDA